MVLRAVFQQVKHGATALDLWQLSYVEFRARKRTWQNAAANSKKSPCGRYDLRVRIDRVMFTALLPTLKESIVSQSVEIPGTVIGYAFGAWFGEQ